MTDTFFALYWSVCGSISIILFIFLLFHISDGVTGLFFLLTLYLTDNTRDGENKQQTTAFSRVLIY